MLNYWGDVRAQPFADHTQHHQISHQAENNKISDCHVLCVRNHQYHRQHSWILSKSIRPEALLDRWGLRLGAQDFWTNYSVRRYIDMDITHINHAATFCNTITDSRPFGDGASPPQDPNCQDLCCCCCYCVWTTWAYSAVFSRRRSILNSQNISVASQFPST